MERDGPASVERLRAELGPLLTVQEGDSGHMVYLEQTAAVAGAIREILR